MLTHLMNLICEMQFQTLDPKMYPISILAIFFARPKRHAGIREIRLCYVCLTEGLL